MNLLLFPTCKDNIKTEFFQLFPVLFLQKIAFAANISFIPNVHKFPHIFFFF